MSHHGERTVKIFDVWGLERRDFFLEKIFERFHIGSHVVSKINVNSSKSAVKWNYYPTGSLPWEVDIKTRFGEWGDTKVKDLAFSII